MHTGMMARGVRNFSLQVEEEKKMWRKEKKKLKKKKKKKGERGKE